jgi:hypothetical protein
MLYPSELQPLDKVYSNLRKPVLHPELPMEHDDVLAFRLRDLPQALAAH